MEKFEEISTNEFDELVKRDQNDLAKNEDEKKEEQLINNTRIVEFVFIILGLVLIILGKGEKEELLTIFGYITIITTILNFAILLPFFKVIASISRNLRKINKQAKSK